jgi:hypothetical protein
VSTTRSPNSTPGIAISTEPVARTTAPASYVVPPTTTFASPSSEASPSIIATLFLSQSIFTPPASASETFARRFESASQSRLAPSTLMPSSAPFWAWSSSSAVCSIVFAGMQA